MDGFLKSILSDPHVQAAINLFAPKPVMPTPQRQTITPFDDTTSGGSAQLTPQVATAQEQGSINATAPLMNSQGAHGLEQINNAGANIADSVGNTVTDAGYATLYPLLAAQQGGKLTPEQNARVTQGTEDIMSPGGLADPANGTYASAIETGLAHAPSQISSGVDEALAGARTQPGGLQAGFIKLPGEEGGVTQPVLDGQGNPVEQPPQPMLDKKGNPMLNQSGEPMYKTPMVVNGGSNATNALPTDIANEGLTAPENKNLESVQANPPVMPKPPAFNPGATVKEPNPMLNVSKADPTDNRFYQSVFQVPSAVIAKMKLKPEQVVDTLIHDGVTGVNLNELENTVNEVTGTPNTNSNGAAGAFPNINNYILSKNQDLVGFGDAQHEIDTGLQSAVEGEKPALKAEVMREVEMAMKPVRYENTPAEFPSNHGYTTDLFHTSQNLADTQALFEKKALDVNGDVKNPEYARVADAVGQVKSKFDAAINNATKDDYQSYKNDPYVQSQLQRVPAPLAKRWMDSATEFKNGQTIQYPYVQASKMLRYTKDKKLAPFTQAIDESRDRLPSRNAGQVAQNVAAGITNPFKGIPQIIGKTAEKIASRYDPSVEDFDRFLTTPKKTPGVTPPPPPGGTPPPSGTNFYPQPAETLGRKPLGAGMKTAIGVPIAATIGGAGFLAAKLSDQQSNAASNDATGNPQENHGGSVSNYNTPVKWDALPTDSSKMAPDSSGLYSAPSPAVITGKDGKPLAYMDNASFNQIQESALDPNNVNDFNIQQKYKQAKIANTQYNDLMSNYAKYINSNNNISNAMTALKDAPPNILQQAKTISGLQTIFNGKYKKAAEALAILNKVDPTDVQNIFGSVDLKTADGVFSSMSQDVTGSYLSTINQFTNHLPIAAGGNATGLPAPTDSGLTGLPTSSGTSNSVHGTPQPFVY